jgi:hypothetical protein
MYKFDKRSSLTLKSENRAKKFYIIDLVHKDAENLERFFFFPT